MTKISPAAIFLFIIGGLALLMGVSVVLLGIYQQELIAWSSIPSHSVEEEVLPPAPDYADVNSWHATPPAPGAAAITPQGTMDTMEYNDVDVFFIVPTGYTRPDRWNVAFDEPTSNQFATSLSLPNMASVFHPKTRVYAPKYRQASLGAFYAMEAGKPAIERAFTDIDNAFKTYLETRNDGRPFFIAGHGQGSAHVARLLAAYKGTSALDNLIAAYAPGFPIAENDFPICTQARDTGCIVSWMTYSDDSEAPDLTRLWAISDASSTPPVCVNPMDWIIDGVAPREANWGAVMLAAGNTETLPEPTPALTGAYCANGRLVMDQTLDEDWHQFDLGSGDMTMYDYNLFYMNIRANVVTRMRAFQGMSQ